MIGERAPALCRVSIIERRWAVMCVKVHGAPLERMFPLPVRTKVV